MALGLAAMACGSRTGLFADEETATTVAGPASPDSGRDGARDAADASVDVALPTIDATPLPDVRVNDCPDAAATVVYLVTSENDLLAFDPPALAFRMIGHLACPAGTATPFSMAVDRKGLAYVVYNDGTLYRVSTANASCTATAFGVDQLGFFTFGMGFATNGVTTAETLWIADADFQSGRSRLGAIDTTTLKVREVGPFLPTIPRAELTGTGDGRLFGYWPDVAAPGGHLVQIDPSDARILAKNDLPIGDPGDAFAFAFWGGDFWIFTSAGGTTEVNRYRPATLQTSLETSYPGTVVGAGVSTCAPQ